MPHYDIFISYRRDTGAQYARNLQLMLERRGYKVFLDYDELVDEEFKPQIESAIKNSSIYLIVLTPGSMQRCANQGDWVRREIELAIENKKKIVPVNADGKFDGVPPEVPEHIRSVIEGIQHSEVNFGQALNATVDLMVKNRIKPYIRKSSWLRWMLPLIALIVIMPLGIIFIQRQRHADEIEQLKKEITFLGNSIAWPDDISKDKLLAIQDIFNNMQPIEGGEFMQGALPTDDGSYHENVEVEFETPAYEQTVAPFYMSKFEVTIGQWNAIMDDHRGGDPSLPISSVSFFQSQAFTDSLFNLTNIEFRLPTETEWEYAAKGSTASEGYMFAGSDNPGEAAWYAENSGGESHSELKGVATIDDLFNMSGNVSEWCDTKFVPYDPNIPINAANAMVIRGGNYDSDEYEITTTHREPANSETTIPTLGFRIALSK